MVFVVAAVSVVVGVAIVNMGNWPWNDWTL
jgi:hypothetical protein